MAIAVFLTTIAGTPAPASDEAPTVGVLEVSVTYTGDGTTVRPLAGVSLRFDCNREMHFPPIRTDTAGNARIRAAYAICRVTAQSPPVIGGRAYLWTSDVEFSRKTARLDLSSDDATVLPVLIHDVSPESAAELRAMGVSSVYIHTTVRRDGTMGEMSVSGVSSSKLNRLVIAALRQRRYEPALEYGWPKELSLETRVNFALPPESATTNASDEPVLPAGLVLPVIVTNVEPVYPDDLRRARIEGAVALQAVVDKEGNVGEIQVLSSSDPRFNEPSIAAVRQRKYKPALQNGTPVAVYYTITAEFHLR
jgi:protein TonB